MMTRHLHPEEFVDAIDQCASAECQAHLAICEPCAAELATMSQLMSDVTTAQNVPEPSPLFWNHLSARVREAVDAEPIAAAWWQGSWRPFAMLASALCAVVLVLVFRAMPAGVHNAPSISVAALHEAAEPQEGDQIWDMIGTVASSMRADEAREAGLVPGQAATDAAFESLTPSQRTELAKLIRAEMRSSE